MTYLGKTGDNSIVLSNVSDVTFTFQTEFLGKKGNRQTLLPGKTQSWSARSAFTLIDVNTKNTYQVSPGNFYYFRWKNQ